MNRILFFGSGSIAKQHRQNLQDLDLQIFELKERQLKEIDLKTYLTVNKIEMAVVCTTSGKHFGIIKDLIDSEIPFYCEKPLFLSNKDVKFFEKNDKQVLNKSCVGFNLRYHPAIKFLKDIFADTQGKIGFQIIVAHDVTKWREGRGLDTLFSLKKDLGGGAISELCHEIDFANYLFKSNKVEQVKSFLDPWSEEVDGQSLVILEGKDSFGSVYLDLVSPEIRRSINCFSKNITITLDLVTGNLRGNINSKKIKKDFEYDRNEVLRESLLNFIYFNQESLNKKIPLNNLNDCLVSSEMIANAYGMLKR